MQKSAVTALLTSLFIIIAVVFSGCSISGDAPRVGKNEILLEINLDLDEDIGLFVIDLDVDGKTSSGGTSNADKSMIKRDDVLYWTIEKELYDISEDSADLSVAFKIVTEYCDPNYYNIYPEEYMFPVDAISFEADFGNAYTINVTGGKTAGYTAALVEDN